MIRSRKGIVLRGGTAAYDRERDGDVSVTDDRQAGEQKKEGVPPSEVTPDLIVTDAMKAAGAVELRQHAYGESLADVAAAVFIAMQCERIDRSRV